MIMLHAATETDFAGALLDPDRAIPNGVTSHTRRRPEKRFAVYRNNVTVSLVNALRARFPVIEKLVGEEFYFAMAAVFVRESPPRSPILSVYGDDFPGFLERFPPMAEFGYAPDVARLEAARTRAYHAADATPLTMEALAGIDPASIDGLRVELHPSTQIVRSRHAIVTIWAMNSGEMELAPTDTGLPEDALVARSNDTVTVTKLAPGVAAFLLALRKGHALADAAAVAFAEAKDFDLTASLAHLFGTGLVTALSPNPPR